MHSITPFCSAQPTNLQADNQCDIDTAVKCSFWTFQIFEPWINVNNWYAMKSLIENDVLPVIWRPKLKTDDKKRRFQLIANNHFCRYAISKIQTATPTFSTMPDLDMALPTLSDVVRLPKCKMAVSKPEVEITFERTGMATRFQWLPHIFDHARLRFGNADIVRLFQLPKLKMTATKTRKWKYFWTETLFQRLSP